MIALHQHEAREGGRADRGEDARADQRDVDEFGRDEAAEAPMTATLATVAFDGRAGFAVAGFLARGRSSDRSCL